MPVKRSLTKHNTHRWLQSQSLPGAAQASSYGSSRQFPARGKHKAGPVKTIQEIKALDVSVRTRLLNPHTLENRCQTAEPQGGGCIGVQSRSAFVVVNATVASIKYDLSGNTYYRSCPNEGCSRKVRCSRPLPLSLFWSEDRSRVGVWLGKVVDVGGSYRCAACNASYDHCQYR